MKKVKESVRDFFDNRPVFTACLILAAVCGVLHLSGFIAWHNDFLESFWANKRF